MGDYREYQGRDFRTVNGIVTQIEIKRRYPGNSLLAFLLVEGSNDAKLYGKFATQDKCHITFMANKDNKKSVIEVLSLLERDKFPGVLAIVDADFDALEGELPITGNLLLTDTHDLETMLIKSPALESILAEFGSQDKIAQFREKSGKDIRTILLECGKPLGYLLWVSLIGGLSLKFEGAEYKKFLDERTLTIDVPRMIKTIKNNSQRHALSETDIQGRLEQLQSDEHDPWYICCGHHLIYILAIGLCKALGTCNSNEVKPEVLERSLRLAFEYAHFRETQLYRSIRKWEQTNAPFMLLYPVP